MTTINSVSPTPLNNFNTKPANVPSSSEEGDSKKLVIEVTPGEDNVDSGDRSNNTAQINITTPNNELEFEVSREQVFNAVEKRSNKKLAEQILGGDNSSRPLLKGAALAQSDLERGDLTELVYLNTKKDQIAVYSQATQNNPYTGSSSNQDSNSSQSPAQAYNAAKNAYEKQYFIFNTIDRLDFSEKV